MIEFWYSALSSPLGIVISTSDPERLRQKLYAARAAQADDSLAALAAIMPPTSGEVWIVKKDPKHG